MRTLSESEWRARDAEHRARADRLTAGHRARKQRGEKHPIEDFLFTYYSIKPSELRRWHPGAGIVLEGGGERAEWKHYTAAPATGTAAAAAPIAGTAAGAPAAEAPAGRGATVDTDAYFARRGGTVDYVERLLSATLSSTPQFGCFGLHEWAMVYRMTPDRLRHRGLSLRIGHEATDRVVETHAVVCSHFDAYRFFTPEAAPLNELRPTRATQADLEQPGCLHAGMDVYKWCGKLGPVVPGELLLDAFELARDIREVDMQASPYDVGGFIGADGTPLAAIPIETPEGKREYARRQRGFAERGNALRERVLGAIAAARADRAARAAGEAVMSRARAARMTTAPPGLAARARPAPTSRRGS
ncbi:3-methyladenine DNA glycosylase [Leucobacter chromiisoli]|uniref:3-methyladenine DNA glycosylase n=1 Tax=Leucobacter chromiisoli TaxID=2796471 RepID=UPI0027DDBA55|nr:3-methyladenine DNA glycosylase [Leucobacter chromiisoli]